MDKTGLEKRQVRNALHRLSKKGRVKSVSTGVYIAIE
jgi:predicted transcriptional regulator of viral defense system